MCDARTATRDAAAEEGAVFTYEPAPAPAPEPEPEPEPGPIWARNSKYSAAEAE